MAFSEFSNRATMLHKKGDFARVFEKLGAQGTRENSEYAKIAVPTSLHLPL